MKSRRRVLLVNDHLQYEGGGDAVVRLERDILENAGYEVHTFSHAVSAPVGRTENDHYYLGSASRFRQKLQKFVACPGIRASFRSVLGQVKPDLVHLHLITKHSLGIYPELKEMKCIQTLHGPNLFCMTGWGCFGEESNDCEMGVGYKCFSRGCVSAARYPVLLRYHRLQFKLARAMVSRFLCPSHHLTKSARSFGLPAEYLPLSIDRMFFAQERAAHDGPARILFVGSLARQKGPHILLEAFAGIHRNFSDSRLIFAGRGDLEEELAARAKDLGLQKSVEFLGFVNKEELVTLYRTAHVVCVPSLWKEQFGLIGPEALACGVPCVGTEIGGIAEWLRDGEWGFLIPPADVGALQRRVEELLGDFDMRRAYGARGRDFVEKEYGFDLHVESLTKVIDEEMAS